MSGGKVEPGDDLADVVVEDCEVHCVLLVVNAASFPSNLATCPKEWRVHWRRVGDLDFDRVVRYQNEAVDGIEKLRA